MSKNKLLIIILMLTVMLTGCFPSGELEQSSEAVTDPVIDITSGNSENSETPQTVLPKLENVKINIPLSDNYPAEAPIIKATQHTFDVEDLKAMFLDGKTVIKEDPLEWGGNFFTADGARLSARKNYFTFAIDHMYDGETEKRDIFQLQSSAANNVRELKKQFHHIDSELEGFPRSEALERANELVEKLDLKYLGEPEVFALTSEDVNSVQGALFSKEDGGSVELSLSKEDEFYLVRYLTDYSDIPIPIVNDTIVENEYQVTSMVDIILTKDNLVSVVCRDVFDNIEVVGSSQIKCGAENVLSKLHEYYSIKDATMEYQLNFYDLGLAYITYESDQASGEFSYKPLWYATGDKNMIATPDKITFTDKFIDPVTGLVFDAGN